MDLRIRGKELYLRGPEVLIEDHGFVTPCWIWQGSKDENGYGRLTRRVNGQRTTLAHRWLYEQQIGPIPPRHHLHHMCTRPSCVRPDHLKPLLQPHHNRLSTKLTAEDVAYIRLSHETLEQLASRFGVCGTTVYNARAGNTFGARKDKRPDYLRQNSARKIPVDKIRAVRMDHSSTIEVAERLGVARGTINQIRRGKIGGSLRGDEREAHDRRKAVSRSRPWNKGRSLTADQVRHVRTSDASLRTLAKELGVNVGTLSQVRSGRTYRDVT